jgi:hypothetical protein
MLWRHSNGNKADDSMLHCRTLFTPAEWCLHIDSVMLAVIIVEVKENRQRVGGSHRHVQGRRKLPPKGAHRL